MCRIAIVSLWAISGCAALVSSLSPARVERLSPRALEKVTGGQQATPCYFDEGAMLCPAGSSFQCQNDGICQEGFCESWIEPTLEETIYQAVIWECSEVPEGVHADSVITRYCKTTYSCLSDCVLIAGEYQCVRDVGSEEQVDSHLDCDLNSQSCPTNL